MTTTGEANTRPSVALGRSWSDRTPQLLSQSASRGTTAWFDGALWSSSADIRTTTRYLDDPAPSTDAPTRLDLGVRQGGVPGLGLLAWFPTENPHPIQTSPRQFVPDNSQPSPNAIDRVPQACCLCTGCVRW